MSTFDEAIDTALASLARAPLTVEMKDLRSLPQRLGGLGLPRHFGPQSEKGCLASRALTRSYIEQHRPELAPGTEIWHELEVGIWTGLAFARNC